MRQNFSHMVILTLVNTKMSSLALLRLNNEVMKIIGALDQLLVFSLCRYSVDALKVVSHILRDCAILHTSYKFNCIKSSGCLEFRLYHSNFTFVSFFFPEWPGPPRFFCWQGWIYVPVVSTVCQQCSSLSPWAGHRGWCLAHTHKQEDMCACEGGGRSSGETRPFLSKFDNQSRSLSL